MNIREHIVVENQLHDVAQRADYLCHALCYEGQCWLDFNGREFSMQGGDCLIVRRSEMLTHLRQSDNLRIDVIYVTPEFIELSTPMSNYGMRGQLSLYLNPIMHLTSKQQAVCALDFDYIKHRLSLRDSHHFYRDAMINAIQCMIIDFFDFHVELYGTDKFSSRYYDIIEQFMAMLDRGDFRQHRDIGYYADRLCVTSKYLSEVSRKVSGYPANYWITRYTALDISRLLRDRSLSLTEISDMYQFSSISYFSRYVRKYLGVAPSDFREKS